MECSNDGCNDANGSGKYCRCCAVVMQLAACKVHLYSNKVPWEKKNVGSWEHSLPFDSLPSTSLSPFGLLSGSFPSEKTALFCENSQRWPVKWLFYGKQKLKPLSTNKVDSSPFNGQAFLFVKRALLQ